MNKEKIYRTLIVDDEKFARVDLREYLSEIPNIEIIGEADTIDLAVEAVELWKPDLIFLDIQFPGETGFDLLDKIDQNVKIIFVTAYNEYAIRAFDVNACDYLLKPINPERLALAINRLDVNKEPADNGKPVFKPDDTIYIELNYKYHFIRINTIITIKAANHFTEVITSKGLKGLTSKHLWEWTECLPKDTFIQINRSTIVNIDFVDRIEKRKNYSVFIFLKNDTKAVAISRRFAKQIKHHMSLS